MGFYPPDSLVHEAQRRGIEVRAPDVSASVVECSVEPIDNVRGERREARGDPAVRIGLGYVKGIVEEEARALVAERARAGAYRDLADLASRSGMGGDGLERLAWAGACEALGIPGGSSPRRSELWQLGVARGGRRERGQGVQLALALPLPAPPGLRPLGDWERIVADYGSTGIALAEHPMRVLRADLGPGIAHSEDLCRLADGARVSLAGLVVARQRPATAKGVVFMLLEDELGVTNVIVPPPVYERCRGAVRTAAFALIHGRLERREGVVNVLAGAVEGLSAPDRGRAPVHRLERAEPGREATEAGRELAAVAPRAHSFGRRR